MNYERVEACIVMAVLQLSVLAPEVGSHFVCGVANKVQCKVLQMCREDPAPPVNVCCSSDEGDEMETKLERAQVIYCTGAECQKVISLYCINVTRNTCFRHSANMQLIAKPSQAFLHFKT